MIDFVRSGALGDINPDKPINGKRMVEPNGAYGCMGDLGMHDSNVPLRLGDGWRLCGNAVP